MWQKVVPRPTTFYPGRVIIITVKTIWTTNGTFFTSLEVIGKNQNVLIIVAKIMLCFFRGILLIIG